MSKVIVVLDEWESRVFVFRGETELLSYLKDIHFPAAKNLRIKRSDFGTMQVLNHNQPVSHTTGLEFCEVTLDDRQGQFYI